ncbi:four-carbon acid sugar kinase family protein [Ammoniphilus resinae]|uniref:Uncharacterized protein YgbK (DUF1537 family) n=1 Tax=Ammoniphilus resinae TaxID=861532 RepID=A0ABS4GQR6_9BACL|nr:four-carbon acid sugar kinase family protein [Ammoniphilus resinae]MBP1932230.1 uncharacterized protein YgbK (DUF1537 family) [Ammoniphilus resinae]
MNLLLCYYGDDFTGSTDSMEGLALHGIKTMLFLQPPTAEQLEQFPDLQCFGVAGTSRSMKPEQMEQQLLPIFQQLQQTPIVHYKVCSTFDSSPEIGSIGKVIDMAKTQFTKSRVIPLLVGAPSLRRYTVFGNHFATVGEETHRLDRHPTMSRHPVTPMDEGDLRIHLNKQTDSKIGLMDILDLEGDLEKVTSRYEQRLQEHPDVLLFDVLDSDRLEKAGSLIWREAKHQPLFVVGSSGVQYALAAAWQKQGLISGTHSMKPAQPTDQLLAISGSCSPVTQGQIEWALENGFHGIRIPMEVSNNWEAILQEALTAINQGRNVILYSALGPMDPSIAENRARGLTASASGKFLGQQLGNLARRIIEESSIRRIAFAGGDTSSHAVSELGIFALEMIAPLAPGSPLCQCYSTDPRIDGLEITLKGGQVGERSFFGKVLQG